MRILHANEVDAVSGGVAVITALMVLGFVYHERNNIRDFAEGVFEGYEENHAKHSQR
ncbi:hypothetical protein H1235_01905 [Pseudoxanthomonas sp. NC8]|nr:hypothetical protein H1235_01905 [Pseudoxanthomonas sp. NC8]